MRAVVQRVKRAKVEVENEIIGEINEGLLVFVGIETNDMESDIDYLCDKTTNLRIFEDEDGKMNKSLLDLNKSMLVISQFTLQGDARKGRRPSFSNAMIPEKAIPMYEEFIRRIKDMGITIATGKFGADMQVELVNDGPVTILLDSKKIF